jgi:hypothetical protein
MKLLNVEVTQDDIDAAKLVGATGAELMEAAIHSALDRHGVRLVRGVM